MKVIFIAGPWGSGTTAVIGALDRLGVPTIGPFFQSSDPRTRNTFELISFRDLVHQYVDEQTVKHKDNYRGNFLPALAEFREQLEKDLFQAGPGNAGSLIALKMPLASICLPEICSMFDTRIIVVHRPLEDIEASRIRRNWPPVYGAMGAQNIYSNLFNDIIRNKLTFLGISYDDFITKTGLSLEKIIDFCDLKSLQGNLDNAAAFVNSP